MIRHCVMLGLSDGHDALELREVMQALDALVGRLPGCCHFLAGENIDLEGKTPEFPYGFTIDFDDAVALENYAQHPEHKLLGGRLVALCGGSEKISVFDLKDRE